MAVYAWGAPATEPATRPDREVQRFEAIDYTGGPGRSGADHGECFDGGRHYVFFVPRPYGDGSLHPDAEGYWTSYANIQRRSGGWLDGRGRS